MLLIFQCTVTNINKFLSHHKLLESCLLGAVWIGLMLLHVEHWKWSLAPLSRVWMSCKHNFTTVPQAHTSMRRPHCLCICTYRHKKYNSRYYIHSAYTYTSSLALLLVITVDTHRKKRWRTIYFSSVTHFTVCNTKLNKGARKGRNLPETEIEILIIKHAQLLRCIANVKDWVKMSMCMAMNLAQVKAYSMPE